MFIKRSKKRMNGKVYEHAHLVSSYNTPDGPRHQVLYSLGKIYSRPERDRELASKLAGMLSGQLPIYGEDAAVRELYESMKPVKTRRPAPIGAAASENLDRVDDYKDSVIAQIEMVIAPALEGVEVEIVQAEIAEVSTAVQKAPGASIKPRAEDIEFRDAREAGPVWVGHNIWEMLGLSSILRGQKFSDDEIHLTEVLALNRLIEPASEHATPEWVARTALSDILNKNLDELNYRKLYGHLDRLHLVRKPIERQLFAREATLFNLETNIYLYDLTSTFF